MAAMRSNPRTLGPMQTDLNTRAGSHMFGRDGLETSRPDEEASYLAGMYVQHGADCVAAGRRLNRAAGSGREGDLARNAVAGQLGAVNPLPA